MSYCTPDCKVCPTINWQNELPQIRNGSDAYLVDWRFITSIRHTENGRPGREFGILSIPAPTYQDQLFAACRTVSHRLSIWVEQNRTSLRPPYADPFIHYFASIWAPAGADNDPNNLNANWETNFKAFYSKLVSGWIPS